MFLAPGFLYFLQLGLHCSLRVGLGSPPPLKSTCRVSRIVALGHVPSRIPERESFLFSSSVPILNESRSYSHLRADENNYYLGVVTYRHIPLRIATYIFMQARIIKLWTVINRSLSCWWLRSASPFIKNLRGN